MSDADSEAITISADGITVRKTVDVEQFQTLAVVLELASERDEISRVQVVDQVPSMISMDDVGFHPEYGSEFWSVEDGAVAFERDLEPGEAFTTIYGLRDYPEAEVEALLDEPQVDLVDTGPDRLEEVIDEDRSQVVREFLSGEANLPGLDDEIPAETVDPAAPPTGPIDTGDDVTASADPSPEPVDEESPHAPSTEADASPGTEPELDPEPADEAAPAGAGREVRVPLTGGVVRVLIKELREGDVDPDDRQMLRDELLDTEGSTETRIRHLQQRMSDLEAYTDALEAFIDEEGTAHVIISDLRDEVAALERTVRTSDDRVDEVLDSLEAVEQRLEGIADDVATVESREEVLADHLEDLKDDVQSMDEEVDDFGATIDQVSVDVDAVDDRTGDVAGRVEDLQDELGTLRRNLQDDLDAVHVDLEKFEAFRERLSSVFGGAGQSFDDETMEE